MLRPGLSLAAALLVGSAAWLAPAPALAFAEKEKKDARKAEPVPSGAEAQAGSTVLKFVQGLRERGYYDLALDYLEQLRKSPDTPADLKTIIDYEMGRSLLEEASHTPDLERRRVQLDQARARLDAFAKGNPNHPLASEALVQMAKLLVERGHLSMLQADDLKEQAEKDAKLKDARASFHEARAAYAKAQPTLQAAYDGFPRFIPEGDPRKDARERAHVALMEDLLQKALVDYEEAQTYPAGSKERNELLDRGVESFKAMYQAHRTQLAGLYARMWQGKCYEEKGELGPAMGIYNELMEHGDPRLRPLQRQVGYFRIIVIGKRKEYALAADEAVRWLQANPASRHSSEGLGVSLELAKDLIAQLDTLKGAEYDNTLKHATDVLGEVVRYYSPHKPEALALLQKYRPKAAAGATTPANLSYDDARAQADVAISAQEWGRAIALLKAAARKTNPTREADRDRRAKELDKLNSARYLLAFAYFQSQNYYEAAVLAEHLARRYPDWGMSPKATEIGMAALAMAYNTYTQRDRKADLDNLIALAAYTVKTWPETDQGDAARVTLGEIYLGQGRYAAAANSFEAVRTASPKSTDARAKAGTAHWRQSLVLRQRGKGAEADAEVKKAEEEMKAALKARQDAGAAPTDAGLIANACDLAEVYLATDRARDALALLDPIAKGLGTSTPSAALMPLVSRLLATQLRAHIGVGQVNEALASMKQLESLGGSGNALTQLYFELGVLLKKEMDALQTRGDQAGYRRVQQAYMKFLQALVDSKAGQSYESLEWAGEAMLSLSQSAAEQADSQTSRRLSQSGAAAESARSLAEDAAKVFQRVLDTYSKDAAFLKAERAEARLFRTRLRLAAALRGKGDFTDAMKLTNDLVEQNKGVLEPQFEKGLLYEDMARSGQGKWSDAYEHWKRLAAALGRRARKPKEYYEASYHVAYVLYKEGRKDEARKTLKSVMRLSPNVGGPEIKARYETLLRQVEG